MGEGWKWGKNGGKFLKWGRFPPLGGILVSLVTIMNYYWPNLALIRLIYILIYPTILGINAADWFNWYYWKLSRQLLMIGIILDSTSHSTSERNEELITYNKMNQKMLFYFFAGAYCHLSYNIFAECWSKLRS